MPTQIHLKQKDVDGANLAILVQSIIHLQRRCQQPRKQLLMRLVAVVYIVLNILESPVAFLVPRTDTPKKEVRFID